MERKKSDTAAATIRARVLEKLPELADGRMIRSSELTNAQRNAYYELTNNLTDNCTWFCLDSVTRDVFDVTNFTLPAVGGEGNAERKGGNVRRGANIQKNGFNTRI